MGSFFLDVIWLLVSACAGAFATLTQGWVSLLSMIVMSIDAIPDPSHGPISWTVGGIRDGIYAHHYHG